jgi:hypothetical protein
MFIMRAVLPMLGLLILLVVSTVSPWSAAQESVCIRTERENGAMYPQRRVLWIQLQEPATSKLFDGQPPEPSSTERRRNASERAPVARS